MNAQLIGVISDTHGLFDHQIPGKFHGVQQILHAGDIGSVLVLTQLSQIAPVAAVLGNIDKRIPGLGLEYTVTVQKVRVFMTHILGDPERLTATLKRQIAEAGAHVVIFGHSHKPFLSRINGVLYFNPGSAGPRRFSLPRSVGLLRIQEESCEGEILAL